MLRVSARFDGLADALNFKSAGVLTIVDDEMKAGGEGLRQDLRQQTEDVLGSKIANAWRGKFYANEGRSSGPAAFIWSKAPKIIDFFSADRVVTPLGQAFAIPTDNVPRGARGRRLTPIEVEARFNAELVPVRLKSGRIGLMLPIVDGRNGRGLRAATKGRRAQGRPVRKVLMFVLLRSVRGRKLIDLEATAAKWGASAASNIESRIGGIG